MKKQTTIKLIALVGISLMFLFAGCVDTSVQPIPSHFNFRSQVKVVNLGYANGISITMNSQTGGPISFGTIAFGAESPTTLSFKDVPAGSKTIVASANTFKFVTGTDLKIRLFIVGNNSTGRVLVKSIERKIWQTKSSPSDKNLYPVDSAYVFFMNGSPDATVDGLIFKGGNTDTTVVFNKTLKMGEGASYMKLPAGSGTVYIISGSDTLSTNTYNFKSQSRYTSAIYDVKSNLKFKIYQDD